MFNQGVWFKISLIVIVIVLLIVGARNYSHCPITQEFKRVNGDSLIPSVKPGTQVKLYGGYYACNPVQRGDLAAYHYGGEIEPLAKFVRGIPGDTFGLEKVGSDYHILINGSVLKNSQLLPYILTEAQYNLLQLYVRDDNGVIPKDAYLIMGDRQYGTVDSTKVGLVGKKDLIGKLVPTF